MKKFVGIFLAMFFCLTSFSTAEAVDLNKVVNTTKAIGKEFAQYERDPSFRDFDFFIKMSILQLKNWNDMLGQKKSREMKIKISELNVAMLNVQYLNMQQYIQNYVIGRSNNKNAMKKKCAKLIRLIEEGLRALQ